MILYGASWAEDTPVRQNKTMVVNMIRKHYYLYIKSRGLAGIYIHIPYCKQACYYCNFHFSTSLKSSDQMVEAIITEVRMRKGFLSEEIQSIYFGGGTPSILPANQINRILTEISRTFKTDNVKEITLEANPDDITSEMISAWTAAGINRISLGVQTFDDQALQSLNRSHSAKEALMSIDILRNSGIENLTIDLMYGLPGQDQKVWEDNINRIVELDIPHVSAYALTIEEGTVFGHRHGKGSLVSRQDEEYEEQYLYMCKVLGSNGFSHYEVSNFAKEGYQSQHNQLYWQGVEYLGLGPGAHSFNSLARQFNVSNNAKYIRSILSGELPMESEQLSEVEQFNEYLLTGLRTSTGINLQSIADRFGIDLYKSHKKYLEKCVENNLAYFNADDFVLTEKGFFVSDGIILKLME